VPSAVTVAILSQVIMRNLFELGFAELDTLTRHLVLFVTFMGAALISEGNKHIKLTASPPPSANAANRN